MKDTVKAIVRLAIITIVAGLALGLTNAITAEPIKEQERLAAESARRAVLVAEEYQEVDLNSLQSDPGWEDSFTVIKSMYRGMNGAEYLGMVVEIGATGYGGEIRLTVGVGADGKVSGIMVGSNSETAGLGAKAGNPDFMAQYKGLDATNTIQVGQGDGNSIEAIAGATVTSRGVTDGVNTACKAALLFGEGE
ncbi:RnfABCDGE type electron transport complex subunit G [Eubacteriales bacterium OttesenSCG-928-M02]|nr:RnfABCDGE type electron transport complex subunit G [Eubacteriales bacterium OttesenSCG-928-M02]